jgi:hypothetical protein
MARIHELGEAGDKDGHIACCMIAELVRKLLRENRPGVRPIADIGTDR